MKKVRLENLICSQEGFDEFSREALNVRQLEKLNMQLARAVNKGGFYKNYPTALSSLDELQTLPFTTAKELADNFPSLCLCSGAEISRIRTEYTTGTTGSPKRMAYSEYDCDRTLTFFVNGLSAIAYPGDSVLICMPVSDGYSLGGLIKTAVAALGAEGHAAGIGKSYGEYLDIIKDKHVNVFIGTPSLLLALVRFGAVFDRAVVSGDALSDSVREYCAKSVKELPVPHYGLREAGLGCAFACDAQEGMHIRENDIICEIVSEDGRLLPDGDFGELVITTIGMDAMPLFRYKTGDFARIIPEKCPCGSNVKRIEVTGRLGSRMRFYENILFAFDDVIDFKVTEKSVIISALSSENEIKSAAEKAFRGMEINIRRAFPTDKPMYTGKRIIMTEDNDL